MTSLAHYVLQTAFHTARLRFHVHLSRSHTNDCGLWFGNETTVRMRTTLENGVIHDGQQPDRAVNSFIHQGESIAMKTLTGRRVP